MSALLERLTNDIQAFHGQDVYSSLGGSIARKKPIFRAIFGAVEIASKHRLLNVMMLIAVIVFYGVFRQPRKGAVLFEYGMAGNNEASFLRLNRCLPERIQEAVSMNEVGFSFRKRVAVVASLKALWQAGGALKKNRHPRPLVNAQSVIGCAAFLLYSHRPFPKELKAVCVASDHSPICRALMMIARQQGLGVCYTQHAPVTEYFPPLDYDLAVLFDRASEAAYARAAKRHGKAVTTPVALLPPFETEFVRPHVDAPPYRIGVCLSFLPDMEGLRAMIDRLSPRSDVGMIKLRRHPRCKQDWSGLSDGAKVQVRSQDEAADEFFKDIDLVVVPNSGVAIEALHLGRPTFYARGLDSLPDDYYGFVRSGVVPEFTLSALDNPSAFFDAEWQERFSVFDETAVGDLRELRRAAGVAFMREVLEEPYSAASTAPLY